VGLALDVQTSRPRPIVSLGAGAHLSTPGLEVLALGGPLWFAPVVLYVVATRTRFGVVSVGTGLLVCTFLALRAVYTDGSSTAALGTLFFPIYFVLALGAYLVVDRATLSFVRRARHRAR
jgi:hypothetical protein